jgi:hypothetical protein
MALSLSSRGEVALGFLFLAPLVGGAPCPGRVGHEARGSAGVTSCDGVGASIGLVDVIGLADPLMCGGGSTAFEGGVRDTGVAWR